MKTLLYIDPSQKQFESFIRALPDSFDHSGTLIYQGRNILKRFEVEGVPLIVKQFRYPHIINRFIYGKIRESKANRSFYYAKYLLQNGIDTPIPIGFIEQYSVGLRYSYYISTELQDAHEMKEFWTDPQIGDRQWILEEFGRFTGNLHNLNILHKDYSSRNILFTTQGKDVTFYLVDLNRMRFGKISEELGCKNMERLWLPDETYRVIAKEYAIARNFPVDHTVERVCYYKDKYMKKSR